MKLHGVLIAFLMFTLVILSGTALINDMDTGYGDTANLSDEDFGDVYNTIDDMYDVADGAKGDTLESEISDTESWESMTKGSYSAVRLIGGSFSLFTDITNAIAQKLNIPEFIIKIAFIAFSIMIAFAIIYMVFRFKG